MAEKAGDMMVGGACWARAATGAATTSSNAGRSVAIIGISRLQTNRGLEV